MIHCNFKKTYTAHKRSFYINIKASFKQNAINVIFGPSGAGKTSILRLLSGLDKIDNGTIKFGDITWKNTSKKERASIAKRDIAYVSQEHTLFPNMTVIENLYFVKKDLNEGLLNELITTLEIDSFLNTKPNELSGGQQQRVALARALAQEPKTLLLDEPFTAIEQSLRNKLQTYLVTLQKKHNFTVIMVSHNLQEVLKMADYVCVIDSGKVTTQGTTSVLIEKNPKNELTGVVLAINKEVITVLIETQQVNVAKQQIATTSYTIGSKVKIIIH